MISKFATLTEMMDKTVSEILKGVNTAIPAHVLEFDTVTQLAKVQISIKFIKANKETFDISPIVNVPVHFPGGDYLLEHQIDKNDEGLLVVSQRCIDGWKENGGISPQVIVRKLDIQDSLFIPGFRSKPKAITGFNNDGIMLRNKDGTHYVWLKNTGDILSDNSACTFLLKADGSIKGSNAAGSFELLANGDFVVSGKIVAQSVEAPSILANGLELVGHAHLAGTPPGNTGPNI